LELTYTTAHRTHTGLVREHNEDNVTIWVPPEAGGIGPIAIVADGLGGHAAGEVASRTAVEEVIRMCRKGHPGDFPELLRAAVLAAHREIHRRAQTDSKLHGMGTTCTVLAFVGHRAYLAHVGDSRAYRYRASLEQLTRDHTMAQQLLSESAILPEEIRTHPAGHILTRALGMAELPAIDIREPITVASGDRFLLCSDGLTGHVSDGEIAEALSTMKPDDACEHLLGLACSAGGRDNISVAIVVVHNSDRTTHGRPGAPR
jgi:protein phosphatase